MNLKNYTSSVPASRTIAELEEIIAKAGALSIHKEYGPDATIRALFFTLPTKGGQAFTIRLPADSDAIFEYLWNQVRRPREGTRRAIEEQAERTAWRLMLDWTLVQFSRIALQKCEPLEVFLPYVWDEKNQRTYFQLIEQEKFKALPEPRER